MRQNIIQLEGGFRTKERGRDIPKMSRNTAAGSLPKIRWDDSNMKGTYANVCNAAGTRVEIVLLFRLNQAWHASQKEVTVQLWDPIILLRSP